MHKFKHFVSTFWFSIRTVYFPGTRILFWTIAVSTAFFSTLPIWSSKVTGQLIDSIYNVLKNVGVVDDSAFYSIIWLTVLWAILDNSDTIIGTVLAYLNVQWRYATQIAYELMFLRKKMEIDIARRESEDYHNLFQRATEKGPFVVWNLAQGFRNYIKQIVKIFFTISILGFSNWLIALIVFVTTVPQIWVGILFGERTYGIWSRKDGKLQRIYYYYRNKIGSATLEINNLKNKFFNKVEEIHLDTQSQIKKEEVRRTWYLFLCDLLSITGFITVFLLLVHNVFLGLTTVGTLIFLRSVIVQFTNALQGLVDEISGDYEMSLYAAEMRKFLQIKPVLRDDTGVSYTNENIPLIEFKDVSFSYPSDKGENVEILKKVNLTIHPGERIAIIGNNGAGKTTLIKLLLRIYNPTKGVILADSQDLKEIKSSDWRDHIAALLQEFTVFEFKTKEAISAYENRETYNFDRVKESAEMSTASEHIEKWTGKYEEQIGKDFGGQELSRGQSQKMAIAAALYKKAPILILDEPTAAIDSESEIKIFQNIKNRNDRQTIIYVSHDMAVVRNADRIISVENGSITESGTHDELIKNNGYYAKVFEDQVKAMVVKN
jgi:ATP-binding cassette subfamily B protein